MSTSTSALPALPPTADIRSITERVNRLISDFNATRSLSSPCLVTAFAASGTFTPDPKCIFGYAVGTGGGGGGGTSAPGGTSQGGSGGAAGNVVTRFFVKADVSPNVSVTIGAGGASASPGGDTTFGSLLTAKGGGGGSTPAGGTPTAAGNVGDMVQLGSPGGVGMWQPNTSWAVGGSGGGPGGALGGSCGGSTYALGNNAAANSGGGGGGAAANNIGGVYSGGAGGSGYLYVVQFLGAP